MIWKAAVRHGKIWWRVLQELARSRLELNVLGMGMCLLSGVGDKGCVLIKDLLMGNKVIKHVDLQMNQITDVGCRSFRVRILRACVSLP